MSISIFLITHPNVGTGILETALAIVKDTAVTTTYLEIAMDSNVEEQKRKAQNICDEINNGDGVLILTDLYGATPSNVACALYKKGDIDIISGLNLPMLLRILNYPSKELGKLCNIALSGANRGIVLFGETYKGIEK